MVVCVDWNINAFAPLVKTLPPRSATTPACFPLTLSSWLFHVNHRKRFAVHQRDRYGLHGDIAFCAEELRPRQGCPHLEASKSGGPRRILAGLQDHAADSAPSPVWMILKACEDAARSAGFTRFEMGATLTGAKLFGAKGYVAVKPISIPLVNGESLPVIHMEKPA